ncbi:DUF3080 family protein [Thaumasiovibrio subtropicus]|uniref:DUF3080 family protein n=1 Tax=Thaumasiovibrio subtropicus TaxID=1891207 RepID=UPI00131E8938|nr:DUF3080 family protein [Thaumasiovibrio subtropicus]
MLHFLSHRIGQIAFLTKSRTFAYLFCFLPLIGCGEERADDVFDTYLNRLSNVIDVDVPTVKPVPPVSLPMKRELKLDIAPITIGLLDAYELRQCGAFQLIAERNSVLGKVQNEITQLQYEIRLLNALAQCLPSVSIELRQQLAPIYTQKQAQISQHHWNAVSLDEEWQNFLRPTLKSFAINSSEGFIEAEQILMIMLEIRQQLDDPQNINSELLDTLPSKQALIYQNDYIGRLYTSIYRADIALTKANLLLSQFDPKRHCGPKRNQTRAEYLRNVFDKFYVAQLQPYLARIDSEFRHLQPLLAEIYQPPADVADTFQPYQQQLIVGDAHRSMRTKLDTHVAYWQSLFKHCRFKVGI